MAPDLNPNHLPPGDQTYRKHFRDRFRFQRVRAFADRWRRRFQPICLSTHAPFRAHRLSEGPSGALVGALQPVMDSPVSTGEHRDSAALRNFLTPLCGCRAGLIASDLLGIYGSLPALLRSSAAALTIHLGDEPGVAELLIAVRPLLRATLRAEILDGPVLPDLQTTLEYLFISLAHEPAEQVLMLYLDAKNRLLSEEVVTRGTITRADIFPREVVRRALDLGATGLIMAHNHPSGDPEPSRSDLDATRAVADAASLFDIILHDHIIVGRSGHCSLRDQGFL